MECVAHTAHEILEAAPLQVEVGQAVVVGQRASTWPAFVFVTAGNGSGWVPARHLSADHGSAMVLTAYDTTELPVAAGEVVTVVDRDDESGWWWCRNLEGREGWVPREVLEE